MRVRTSFCALALMMTLSLSAYAQGGKPGGAGETITSLTAKLTALTERVGKLEGNIAAPDLAGTYAVTLIDMSMTGLRVGPPLVNATISTSAIRAALILNADGTGNTAAGNTFSGCEGSTLTQGTWAMTGFDCSGPPTDVTWTYADGVITITFLDDGDQIPFNVAVGGRLLIQAFSPFHPSDPSSDHVLVIATRLK
jgi:hypothetical protein